jgi:ABC-2 type transport system permease protein
MDAGSLRQVNPIIVKELRSRMRGFRAFATLTAALLFLSAFLFALYRMAQAASTYGSTPLSPQIGQVMFFGLGMILLVIVAAIAPSVSAGSISSEKEKLTYDMLLATPLHPASILWGKLVAALSYVFLLLFASIPMASLVFMFGGVNIRDLFKVLIVLLVETVMFGVIGLFLSALLERTGRATAAAYLVVLFLVFAPLFFSIMAGVMRQGDPPRWMLIPSPLTALASAMMPSVNSQNFASMFWMLGSPVSWVMGSPPISLYSIPRPIYHYSLPIYGLITLILYMITTRLVRPSNRWRITLGEAMLAIVLILGYTGIVSLGFILTSDRYENYLYAHPAEQQDISPEITPVQPLNLLEPPVLLPASGCIKPLFIPLSAFPDVTSEIDFSYAQPTHRRFV